MSIPPVLGRRSLRRGGGARRLSGLELLAQVAADVDACSQLCGCGHSDTLTCFLTTKQLRKSTFLRTHHSLFLNSSLEPRIHSKKAIKRLVILPPRRPPPSQPPADISPSSSPPAAEILVPQLPPSNSKGRILPQSIAGPPPAPTLPALSPEEFPPNLKSRVSSIVSGGVLEDTFALVIRKSLQITDLNPGNNRLSMPKRRVNDDFLTGEEKTRLQIKNEKVKLGCFLDTNLEPTSGCVLVKWNMNHSPVYNIIGRWNSVLKKRQQKLLKLEAGDEIEVWSFRLASGELCMAMVNDETRRLAAMGGSIESASGGSTVTEEESPVLGEDSSSPGIDSAKNPLLASSNVTGEESPVLAGDSSSRVDLELRLCR